MIFSRSPQGTAEILAMVGFQDVKYCDEALTRMGRRPKRVLTRRLYLLQGLPGIGPTTAKRMLAHFGSVEKAIIAGEEKLAEVTGIGRKKAARIREVVS